MAIPGRQPPIVNHFDANAAALRAFRPQAADVLRAAESPVSAQFVAGRDGAPTYAWTDPHGLLRWLGRTSMPTLSSAALVEAFEPGTGNILLNEFGQGGEARLLLQRLAPHQAVMVVDQKAWAVALSLRLYDFADDLRRGRLLLFAGPDAWEALRDFLLDHDGYLTPERVLSWPWFDAGAVAEVTNRLSAISSQVASHRAAKHAELRRARARRTRRPPGSKGEYQAARTGARGSSAEHSIAIVSNVSDARVRTFAGRLKAAADSRGWSCTSFVLDSPAAVHPHAIESALREASPTVLVLLDVGPDALQYGLPTAPMLVACTHGLPLSSDWVRRLPPSARLGVTRESQRAQAVELGIDPRRLVFLPPAAAARSAAPPPVGEGPGLMPAGILVIAEACDVSPEAAGLHLASHRELWETATKIVRDRCDTYSDVQAEAVLRDAEKKLSVKLQSEEVRQGLAARVRAILGPAIVRRSYCLALVEAGIEFDLYGGWKHDPVLGKYDRGNWPADCGLRIANCGLEFDDNPPSTIVNRQSSIVNPQSSLAGHGVIISIESSGCLRPALLDGMAAGLAAFVRAHPSDATRDGLSAVLDPAEHVWRFDSRQALVQLVRKYKQKLADFQDRAAAATRHVNTRHTWAARLTSIIQACGGER